MPSMKLGGEGPTCAVHTQTERERGTHAHTHLHVFGLVLVKGFERKVFVKLLCEGTQLKVILGIHARVDVNVEVKHFQERALQIIPATLKHTHT